MSKLDDIVSFLETIEYSSDYLTFTPIDVAHEVDYRILSNIPLSSDSTARMLVKNMEVLYTDYLRGTITLMVDLEMEAEDEEDAEALMTNLVDRVYKFNNRVPLYAYTLDWEDDFDSNAIGSAPAGWAVFVNGNSTLTIESYLTHAKCAALDLVTDPVDDGLAFMSKAITTGKDYYRISFDMAFINTNRGRYYVGADDNGFYSAASEGKLDGGTTAWKSYEIHYDVTADTYEIFTDGVGGGDVALNGMSIAYMLAYNNSVFSVDDGIMYLDNVSVEWRDIVTRPTKMVNMDLLNYGNLVFQPQIPNWKGTYRLAITYTI